MAEWVASVLVRVERECLHRDSADCTCRQIAWFGRGSSRDYVIAAGAGLCGGSSRDSVVGRAGFDGVGMRQSTGSPITGFQNFGCPFAV